MKKISNFIPNKVIKKKENIDKYNVILKNNISADIASKVNIINYSLSSITIECADSSIASIIKFEREKYIQIFFDHGLYNIKDVKIKLIQFQQPE